MEVYVVASQDNLYIARELFSEYKDISMTTRYPEADKVASSFIRRKMESADIILVIVDEQFVNSRFLNEELKITLISSSKNRKQIIVPIIIGDANIPDGLSERLYIPCKSKEKEDLYWTKKQMESILLLRKHDIKKKQKEDSNTKNRYMVILTLAMEVFAIFVSLFISLFISEQKFSATDPLQIIYDDTFSNFFIIIIFIMAVCILGMSYFSLIKKRMNEDVEEEVEAYSRRLKKAIVSEEKSTVDNPVSSEQQKNEIDALGRMLINLEDIKEFYTWSQKQAKASFILSIMLCFFGFVLLTIAVVLPLVFKMDIQVSIVPAVGGVITELIAGTALIIYRNSILQLNHYHKALHEDERFLSSVNLLGKFSNVEAQDEMLKEIIRSEIQMNILELNSVLIDENNSKKSS